MDANYFHKSTVELEKAQALSDKRLVLLKDIADWYEGPEEYMSASSWKRVAKELEGRK